MASWDGQGQIFVRRLSVCEVWSVLTGLELLQTNLPLHYAVTKNKKEPFSLNNHEIHYKCSCFWRRMTRSYDTIMFFRKSERNQYLTWKSEGQY